MSDNTIAAMIVAGFLLLLAVAWMSLRQARKSNQITTMALLEKLLGSNHPQLSTVTSEVLDPSKYSIGDLLKAARLASAGDMNQELLMDGNFVLEEVIKEIKAFGDRVILIRGIYENEIRKDSDMVAGLLRVWKGQKVFTFAFRVAELPVSEPFVPEGFKQYIRYTQSGEAFMKLIIQGCFLIGQNGYEVKRDFIESLITKTRLPDTWKEMRKSSAHISRYVYDHMDGLMVQQIDAPPTTGYYPLTSQRNLELEYHGTTWVIDQQKALELLADKAIIEDQSTVFIKGDPGSGKTAFLAFLQEYLGKQPDKVAEVIYGTGDDLALFVGPEGRRLQLSWSSHNNDKLRVIFIDDAVGVLENTDLTQSLLSLMDGQLKKHMRCVLVLSVNRDLDKVPADILRPGRKSVTLNFPELTTSEALSLYNELADIVKPPQILSGEIQEGRTYLTSSVFELIVNSGITQAGLEQALKEVATKKTTISIPTRQSQIRKK